MNELKGLKAICITEYGEGAAFVIEERSMMVGQFTLEHWTDGVTHVGRLAEIPFVTARGASVEELRKNIQAVYRESFAPGSTPSPEGALREPLQLELPDGALGKEELPPIATIEEWEAYADEAIEEFARMLGPNPPVLSDEALSRESFYEGNPKL